MTPTNGWTPFLLSIPFPYSIVTLPFVPNLDYPFVTHAH